MAIIKNKTRFLLSLLVLTGIVALLFVGQQKVREVGPNQLSIGTAAQTSDPVPISITQPIFLNERTKEEILMLRQAAVNFQPDLISHYHPSEAVFGRIIDGLSWWSIQGMYFYGKGEQSTNGKSDASRVIMNPFLLVSPTFWGLSIWRKSFKWDMTKVTEKDLRKRTFPLFVRERRLVWHPAESRAEVTYEVSDFMRKVSEYTEKPVELWNVNFGLSAINARDLGFTHLSLDLQSSHNIKNRNDTRMPVEIDDRFYPSNQCGTPGGCNRSSRARKELSYIQVKGLPAVAHILLWSGKPDTVAARPDMTFDIRFE